MKMKIRMLAFLAAMLIIPVAAQNAAAQKSDKKADASKQKKQSFVLKANKMEAGRGGEADPNIKDESTVNSQNQDFPAPKEKSGGTTRGAQGVCTVILDNQTKWRIQIYVDGTYRGTMAPFGDSTSYTGAGLTRVYARAVFDDGSSLSWGPQDYTCYSGQYINFRMDP